MRLISFLNGNRSGRGVETAVGTGNPLPVATSTNTRIVTATIASGESASTAITLSPGERIVGIIMPAAWTTANIVPSVSYEGITYQYALSYGSAIQMFPVAGFTTQLDPVDADKISRLPYVKLVSATASGSTVTAVNQAAERVLQVVVVSHGRTSVLSMQPAIVMDRLAKDNGATAAFGDAVHTVNMLPSGTFTQATLAKRPMATFVNGWPAMQFDGVDDWLMMPGDAIGTGDVTVVAAIRPTGIGSGSSGRIISNGKFAIAMQTTDRLQITSDDSATVVNTTNNSASLNSLMVVVVVRYSNGTAEVYINGSLVASGSSGSPSAGSDTYIGNRAAEDRAFQGSIYFVSIYKRALTASDVQRLTRALRQNKAPNTWSFSVSAGSFKASVTNAGTTTWQLPDGTTTTTSSGSFLNTTLTQGQVNATADWNAGVSEIRVDGPSTALAPMRFSDLPIALKSFTTGSTGPTIVGSLADLPRGLTSSVYLYSIGASSVITGSLADLPRGLTWAVYLYGIGSNSVITGSLADLPRGLTGSVYLSSIGTYSNVVGSPDDVSGVAVASMSLFGQGLSAVSGSVSAARLSPSVNTVRLRDCNFSPEDTDNNIINLLAALGAGTGASPRTAVFETNRTSASDDAVAGLTAKGWTVTFA